MNSDFEANLLEGCVAISKHLAHMKTGSAKLEINLGAAHFHFSVDHSTELQTGSTTSPKIQPGTAKKCSTLTLRKHKTPSQRRRDQRRWEEFQAKKPPTSGYNVSSLDILPTIAETSSIVEPSPIVESQNLDISLM